jgi:hypothetical protein
MNSCTSPAGATIDDLVNLKPKALILCKKEAEKRLMTNAFSLQTVLFAPAHTKPVGWSVGVPLSKAGGSRKAEGKRCDWGVVVLPSPLLFMFNNSIRYANHDVSWRLLIKIKF